MNERIRDLYEQACDIERENELATKPYKDRVVITFAELIARECMEICRSEDWEDQQGWGKLYAHKIKKHFGVEE